MVIALSFFVVMLDVCVVHAADVQLRMSAEYDGGEPIVLDAAWFGDAADADMRVAVVDATNGVSYLAPKAGELEVAWNPPATGTYRLTLERRDGEEWMATGYARELTVSGITTATADDIALNLLAQGEAVADDTFVDIALDTRTNAVVHPITYSSEWTSSADGVKIYQDNELVFAGIGEGMAYWNPKTNGTYVLTHRSFAGATVIGVDLDATFVVTDKDVPFPEGVVMVTGWEGKYDGQSHGISVTTTGVENPTITYALDAKGPFDEKDPTFVNVTNQTVWCVVAADGYVSLTNSASVVISCGDIGGGGEEPGSGEIPKGGLSKFDATYVYDGLGHTINTQKLEQAAIGVLGGLVPKIMYGRSVAESLQVINMPADIDWSAMVPVYTNVGSYVIWYQISSPNYNDYTHSALLTIQKRPQGFKLIVK